MARYTGVPPEWASRPLRTLRTRQAGDVYAHPRPQLARLEARGLLHRVARGYYVVVPQDQTGDEWMPTLEAAAAGIAAADFGPRAAFLMGTSAARVHGAIPRALTRAVVAAPRQRNPVPLVDRDAEVHFVTRDTARLDVEAVTTELGRALVTSPEQTLLDLGRRPGLGGVADQVPDAVRALYPRCDVELLSELATEQHLRAALRRVRQEWLR